MAFITGTAGIDTIVGTVDADQIYGLTGADKIRGGSGNDFIDGGDGNDNVNGEAGDDTIYGGEGRDVLTGDAGNDILYGGIGNDGFFGGGGNDQIYGEAGDDNMFGDSGDDVVYGGSGVNRSYGGTGNDTIVIVAGEGSDTFVGGVGMDNLDLRLTSGLVTDALRADMADYRAYIDGQYAANGGVAGMAALTAGGTEFTFSSIGLTVSLTETIKISVDGTEVPLTSFLNSDTQGPTDWTFAASGTGSLKAGTVLGTVAAAGDPNSTAFSYKFADGQSMNGLTVDAHTGAITIDQSLTSSVAMSLIATDQAGNHVDKQFAVTVGTSKADTLAVAGGATLTFGQGGDDTITGSAGNDAIYGGAGNDRIADGAGNDKVYGGSGNDRFVAGEGADSYVGGKGFDTADFSQAQSGITVQEKQGYQSLSSFGTKSLVGFESVIGSQFADNMKGYGYIKALNGGAGDDVIRSMEGVATLTGGAGKDSFVYFGKDLVNKDGGLLGVDHIADFAVGTDKLDLHGILHGRGAADIGKYLHVTESAAGEIVSVNIAHVGFANMVVLDGVHHVTAAELLQAGSVLL